MIYYVYAASCGAICLIVFIYFHILCKFYILCIHNVYTIYNAYNIYLYNIIVCIYSYTYYLIYNSTHI
jgi:hypothetical protein